MRKYLILFLFTIIDILYAQIIQGQITSMDGFEIKGANVKVWEKMDNTNPDKFLKETITNRFGYYSIYADWYNVNKPIYITIHYLDTQLYTSAVYRDFIPDDYAILAIDASIHVVPSHEFRLKDGDRDKIPDDYENYLAHKFAPLVYIHPDEQSLPVNVEWFLQNTTVKYKHYEKLFGNKSHTVFANDNPSDPLNQSELPNLIHWPMKFTKNPLDPYDHDRSKPIYARITDRFYLTLKDASYGRGTTNKSLWKVYFRVRASRYVEQGFDIQYWFIYANNPGPDGGGKFDNHEGDWEHITVTVTPMLDIHSIFFDRHGKGKRYFPGQFQLTLEGRPIAFSAKGSHGLYPLEGKFSAKWGTTAVDAAYYATLATAHGWVLSNPLFLFPFIPKPDEFIALDETKKGGTDRQWETWNNLINIGERNLPLNDQIFVFFAGRWGLGGKFSPAPPGPTFRENDAADDGEFISNSWSPVHVLLDGDNDFNEGKEAKFWASETITVEKSQVRRNGKLYLQAGNSINLRSGFLVEAGGSFRATLETFRR